VVPGLDYFTASGPAEVLPAVLSYLREWWGPAARCRGMNHFWDSWRWLNGAKLLFTEDPDGTNHKFCCLMVPGEALAEWGDGGDRLDRTRELRELGLSHVTRADIPVDFMGEGLTLLDDLEAAHGRGEMCGPRMLDRDQRYRMGRDGKLRLVKDVVNLGTRGNGGAMVCAYEKGLERSKGKGQPGQWIRWEARFERESAEAVMSHLWAAREWERDHEPVQLGFLYVGVRDEAEVRASSRIARCWQEEYLSLAFASVDFRERRSGQDRHRSRRRRAAWWVELLGEIVPGRLRRARRPRPSLERRKRFLMRSVFRSLRRMERDSGQDTLTVLRDLGYERVRAYGEDQASLQYGTMVAERRAAG
jgi:hypothetical protein